MAQWSFSTPVVVLLACAVLGSSGDVGDTAEYSDIHHVLPRAAARSAPFAITQDASRSRIPGSTKVLRNNLGSAIPGSTRVFRNNLGSAIPGSTSVPRNNLRSAIPGSTRSLRGGLTSNIPGSTRRTRYSVIPGSSRMRNNLGSGIPGSTRRIAPGTIAGVRGYRASPVQLTRPASRRGTPVQYRVGSGGLNATGTTPISLFIPAASIWVPEQRTLSDHAIGPEKWPYLYPQCSGRRQSPINIEATTVRYSGSMDGVTLINFRSQNSFTLSFYGDTVKLKPRNKMYLRGVGVPGETYIVDNVHFHWSSIHQQGSEHAFNGVLFPLEMHIVSYRSKLGSVEEAEKKLNGLAALGVIYDLGQPNSDLWSILAATDEINNGKDQVTISLNPRQLMPASLDHFFRYHGSLTTPPCTENVVWTIFEHVQSVSMEQFRVFQSLRLTRGWRDRADKEVTQNSRPVQMTNHRAVVSNNPVFA